MRKSRPEKNGQIEKKLLPGTYLVKELPVDRYVTPSAQYVTIEAANFFGTFQQYPEEVPRPCGKERR